jgi:hypothetical protein
MDDLKKSLGLNATVEPTSYTEKTDGRVSRVGEPRGRSVAETKELIKQAIKEAGRPMSYIQICAAVQRKQTPHMRNMLHQMGDSGELIETVDIAPSRMMTRFWYSLP